MERRGKRSIAAFNPRDFGLSLREYTHTRARVHLFVSSIHIYINIFIYKCIPEHSYPTNHKQTRRFSVHRLLHEMILPRDAIVLPLHPRRQRQGSTRTRIIFSFSALSRTNTWFHPPTAVKNFDNNMRDLFKEAKKKGLTSSWFDKHTYGRKGGRKGTPTALSRCINWKDSAIQVLGNLFLFHVAFY
jgi:hypothetical protein